MRRMLLLCTAVFAVTGCAGAPAPGPAPTPTVSASASPERPVTDLPQSTTFTKLTGLPLDTGHYASLDGTVVRPLKTKSLHASPGGPAVAALPSTQLGGPTWVPVVETVPGWQ